MSTGADRPLPANFLTNFPSSDHIGRLPTDEFSTDVTRNRSRVDTTSAFVSSSPSRHQHHLFHPPSSQHEHQHQQPSMPLHSYNIYDSITSTDNNNTLASSDNHLDPSSLAATAFLPQEATSGSRDDLWSARLSSGIDLVHPRSSPTATQSHISLTISPSSTPLQSNLSTKHSNSTSPQALSPPRQTLPLAVMTAR